MLWCGRRDCFWTLTPERARLMSCPVLVEYTRGKTVFLSQTLREDPWVGSATRLGPGRAWPAKTALDISSPRWIRRHPYSKEVARWQTLPVRLKEGSSPG